MSKFRSAFSFFIIAFTLAFQPFSHNALANEKQQKKRQYADRIGRQILATVDKAYGEKRIAEMDKIISQNFDIEWNSKFALGQNYKALSEAQRPKFHDLYKRYLIANYIESFKNTKFSASYVIEDVVPISAKDDLVKTTISNEGKSYKVDFRIREYEDGSLKVLDIIAEGISIAQSYRTQFLSLVDNGGIERVFEFLNEKVNAK